MTEVIPRSWDVTSWPSNGTNCCHTLTIRHPGRMILLRTRVYCWLPSVVPLLWLRGWRSTQAQQLLRVLFALFWGCVDSVTAELYGLMMYLHYVLVLNSIYNYLISGLLSMLCMCLLVFVNVFLVLKHVCYWNHLKLYDLLVWIMAWSVWVCSSQAYRIRQPFIIMMTHQSSRDSRLGKRKQEGCWLGSWAIFKV